MGTFDPNTFLNASLTEANDTVLVPVDEGTYTAIAGLPVFREWQSKDGTKSGISFDLPWELDSAEQKAKTGRDKLTVRQSVMLDLNEAGGIDTGKGRNVALGRLREALGLNTPGQPFSFQQLAGRVAKVQVKNRPGDDGTIYNDVKGVAPLA